MKKAQSLARLGFFRRMVPVYALMLVSAGVIAVFFDNRRILLSIDAKLSSNAHSRTTDASSQAFEPKTTTVYRESETQVSEETNKQSEDSTALMPSSNMTDEIVAEPRHKPNQAKSSGFDLSSLLGVIALLATIGMVVFMITENL